MEFRLFKFLGAGNGVRRFMIDVNKLKKYLSAGESALQIGFM
jgi:hypothetical protein